MKRWWEKGVVVVVARNVDAVARDARASGSRVAR